MRRSRVSSVFVALAPTGNVRLSLPVVVEVSAQVALVNWGAGDLAVITAGTGID